MELSHLFFTHSENFLIETSIILMFSIIALMQIKYSDLIGKSIWISVEGNISSGKTTLLNYLKYCANEGHDFGLTGV